jgi:predicted nucleotidyltransferase
MWITYLQREIKQNKKILNLVEKYNFTFYLFGSAKTKRIINDIDILLIYDNEKISIEYLLKLKNDITKFLFSLSSDLDLLILSKEEEIEINFIKSEEALFIIGRNMN